MSEIVGGERSISCYWAAYYPAEYLYTKPSGVVVRSKKYSDLLPTMSTPEPSKAKQL